MAASPTHWQWVWGLCQRHGGKRPLALTSSTPSRTGPRTLDRDIQSGKDPREGCSLGVEARLFLFLGVLWPGTFGGAH